MAGIANNPNSPRQKMINLMYLVFIAMMALNVSSEVLDGFELVEGSLRTSIDNTSTRNEIVTEELKAYYQTNPEKVREWYEKGTKVKEASDSLYNYVQDLKCVSRRLPMVRMPMSIISIIRTTSKRLPA